MYLSNNMFNSPVIININYTPCNDVCQDLKTWSSSQKENKKVKDLLVDYIEQVEHNKLKAKRIEDCASFIQFKNYHNIGIRKLDSINLCRERLCLNCQKALAKERIPEYMYAVTGEELRHVVLTVKNVKSEFLRQTIQDMRKALKRMMRSAGIKDYIPSTEITYNEKTGEYHPHIHLLLKANDFDISKTATRKLWADNYNAITGTNFKYLIAHNEKVTDSTKACFELCKYISKPASITRDTIPVLYNSLKGLHMHQANGKFKNKIKEYRDQANIENEQEEMYLSNFDYVLEQYLYNGDNYIKVE